MTKVFEEVHARLRAMMLDAAPQMIVMRDEAGSLELRTSQIDPKTKQPGWFGTVTTKKSYVAVHLMPLYTNLKLASDLTPKLSQRRQGKTCFNFTKIDEGLFDELKQLILRCAQS